MSLSGDYLQLRNDAWAAAAERSAAARSLETAADGLAGELDAAVAALTPDAWESAVAAIRAEELSALVRSLRVAAEGIATVVADLRADAARHEDAAQWFTTQYWHAWQAELDAVLDGPDRGPHSCSTSGRSPC